MDIKTHEQNHQRLILGFCIIISFFLGFGLFTLSTIQKLSKLTNIIYNHPLAVSNASLQANVSIAKMHRNMKDVVLFDSKLDLDRFLAAVNKEESDVYENLDIIKSKIIGVEGQQLEETARRQFTDWKIIRSEVIDLVKNKDRKKAAIITVGKGARHVERLEEYMLGLTTYARNKAADFINQKEKEYQKAKTILILFLISSITASLIVSFLTFRHNKNAQKNLTSSEKKYRSLVETQTDLVSRFNNKGEFTFVNEVFCKFFNKTRDELLGGTWQPLPYEEDVEYVQSQLALLSKENPTIIIENRLYSGTGDIHWMQFINKGFYDNFGNFQEIQSVGRDITEQKRTEIALISSEERHKMLFKLSSDAILLVGLDNLRLLDANEAAINLYGYSYKEILQMKATDLSAEKQKTRKAIQKSHDKSVPVRFHKKKDGTVFPVEITANNFTIDEKEINISSIRDITDRIESEKQIKRSLQEKEILLKEIHHRVKNNMQIIQSLFSLQLNTLEDKELRQPLIDSGNRIKSMALIHETLYNSEDIAHLDVKTYFDHIVQHLFKIYNKSDIHVDIKIDLPPQDLNLDCCITSGLIINELISNALKYAFPDTGKGNLSICLNKTDEKYASLIVKDDGCGLPEDFNIEKSQSLGLRIVKILTKGQMNGHLTVTSKNGARFEITFPLSTI